MFQHARLDRPPHSWFDTRRIIRVQDGQIPRSIPPQLAHLRLLFHMGIQTSRRIRTHPSIFLEGPKHYSLDGLCDGHLPLVGSQSTPLRREVLGRVPRTTHHCSGEDVTPGYRSIGRGNDHPVSNSLSIGRELC